MSAGLRRLLHWIRPCARRMALAVSLQAATLSASLGLMATSAWLISAAALHPSIAALQVSIVGVRFFGIARGVLRYLERLVSHDATLRILTRLRVRIYEALEPRGAARLAGSRSGDLLARLTADIETLEGLLVRAAGPTASAILVALVLCALLWAYDASLAFAAAAGLLVAGTLVPWAAWRLGSPASRDVVWHRAEVTARVVDAVQGAPDLAAFGQAAAHARSTADSSQALSHAQLRGARAATLGSALVGLSSELTALAVLALALALVPTGGFDPINLALVTLATFAAFEAVQPLPSAWQQLGAVSAAADRVTEMAGDEVPAALPAGATPLAGTPRALEVRGLTFTYPGSARPALRDVSLRLGPGRPVAIVGPSGSGKSTLAHLLLRLWEPPAGTIWLDGRDAVSLDHEAARAALAFVPQRTHLFTATLEENLRIGRPDATAEAIETAIRRARLDSVVAALPEGLGTWLGEQGARLSGGERQRVAIARALLRDAPFLVCDEPTSHLDPATATHVLDEIYRESETRGVLVITHQLAGLERMAEIIVLASGAGAERGTFGELQRRRGLFDEMLRLERDWLG